MSNPIGDVFGAPPDYANMSEEELAAEDARLDAEGWPEPEPLGTELPPVPLFDLHLLPESLRPWVEDVADLMQVPIDYPATAAIATLAGVCGRRAEIQPKAKDTQWIVVPNLWGALIGSPGDLKTPTIATMTKPARAIEAEWRSAHQDATKQYEDAQEIAELDLAVWKEQYKRTAKKDKASLPTKPEANLTEPVQRRLIMTDATPEALHKLLEANPAGPFCLRDEITGWLAGFEKPGREQERSFWLECWNGNGLSFTIDRIGRGSIHVPHPCASLFGGIQPDRLRAYMAEALRNGPSNDGLIQRIQLATWPDPKPHYTYVDRAPNTKAASTAEQVYRRIANMDAQNPLRLKFAPDAQALFEDWLTDLEGRLRSDDMSPFMVAHLAKYRSLMPSLALLLYRADNSLETVGLTHAQKAADLCTYYEAHARRMYASRISPEHLAAISLGKRLKKGWKKDEGKFKVRDVYQNDWSGLGKPEEVRGALEVLREAKWIREPIGKSSGNGRPPEVYLINPRIWEGQGDH